MEGEREIWPEGLLRNQLGDSPPGVMENDDLANGDDACHMLSIMEAFLLGLNVDASG